MKIRAVTLAIAASASVLAGQVHAQDCITEKQVESLAIYALPSLVDGVQNKCMRELRSDGFLAMSGAAFVQPYAERQDAIWPEARAAFMIFAAEKGEEPGGDDLLASLPDAAVRPILDLVITEKLGEAIKLSDCGKIERALELISPLPPENTGGLIALVAGLAGVDDPAICGYTGKP